LSTSVKIKEAKENIKKAKSCDFWAASFLSKAVWRYLDIGFRRIAPTRRAIIV